MRSVLLLLTLFTDQQFTVEVLSQSSAFTVEVEKPKQTTKQHKYYVVVFSAQWCGPCRNYHSSVEYQKINKFYATPEFKGITSIDIDEFPQWSKPAKNRKFHVERLPTVWLVNRETGIPVKAWTGVTTLQTIQAAEEELVYEKTEPISSCSPLKPIKVMSHSGMVSLHNKLHGGGQWTWPGNLKEHLETTHGVRLNDN